MNTDYFFSSEYITKQIVGQICEKIVHFMIKA